MPPEIEEHVDIPVDREPSDTDIVREPPVEQGGDSVDADRDNPSIDQAHNRANEERDDTSARHEMSNSNEEPAVNQHRSRQHPQYSNNANKTDNTWAFIPDSQPSSNDTIAFNEQHPAQNAKSDIPVCCTAHSKLPAEKPVKNGGVQPSTALKTAIPDKPKAPLPVHKKDMPIAPPVTFSVKQPAQNKSGSSGGGPHLTGSTDAILAESISIKLTSRRIYAKNTRQLITKWANEPPNKPPKYFLFSTMN
ncbi:hypothetical protein DQG23_17225 [Paenibacillus contaminans]|uniref:Uncharacterized protein n=2 Tax=Paenibacillus contaminans TaxID=450362 RepID=A0A329MK70_9BACL|nr:hypothetical protein DQG23_17225 [Paenibacillus contaminans]